MKLSSTALIAGIISLLPSSLSANDWEDPQIFAVNREAPHASMTVFADAAKALRKKSATSKITSSRQQSLNGDWKFHWCIKPADRPLDFYKPEYDVSNWKTIPVPSNWQMHGYGRPIYVNNMDHGRSWWGGKLPNPPEVDHSYNPVGSYRREFTLPASWSGNEVFIHFGGVQSAFYLWVNGKKVGYAQGSMTPSEFNITQYLKPGKNTIAAEVYRWCDGSFLEDQDMWRLSGIHRDVTLVARPKTYLRDFTVRTDLDATYTDATLSFSADIRNLAKKQSQASKIRLTLLDGDKKIWSNSLPVPSINSSKETTVTASASIANPKKWTAETPYLYTLLIEHLNADGSLREAIPQKVGFRKVEIKDGIFMVNGVHVKMRGVNRHDMHPTMGQAISADEYRKELTTMKRFNINAVRTAHYPNPTVLYNLADELGLYIMDEANMEFNVANKGNRNRSNPEWRAAFVDRMAKMVERDKNHPSVVIWSLGNEACAGENFVHMADYARKHDPTRFIHYDKMNHIADMDSRMYPHVNVFRNEAKKKHRSKPFLACEYLHAMGNAIGNADLYWEAIESSPYILGGYIWDWRDQGLLKTRPDGTTFYAYGGDFGDVPNSGHFCLNGLFLPDLTPTGKTYEIKKVFEPVGFKVLDALQGKVEIRNKQFFASLDRFNIHWTLTSDGEEVEHGKLPQLTTAAQSSEIIKIPFKKPAKVLPGSDYQLNLSFTLNQDQPWAPKGFEVAWKQFRVPFAAKVSQQNISNSKLNAKESPEGIVISSAGKQPFNMKFDAKSGTLSEWNQNGTPLIDSTGHGPILSVDRASIDNTSSNGWKKLRNLKPQVKLLKISEKSDDRVSIKSTVDYRLNASTGFTLHSTWIIWKDGTASYDCEIEPYGSLPNLPCVGVVMKLNQGLKNLTWYGRGPFESYPDRKLGAKIDRYTSTVAGTYVPYPFPQEHANMEDVNWIALTSGEQAGFLVRSRGALSAKPTYFTPAMLDKAKHPFDLKPLKQPLLFLHAKVMGLGNASCGPGVLNQYLVKPQRLNFGFDLRPITKGSNTDKITTLARPPARVLSAPSIQRDDEAIVRITAPSGTNIEYKMEGKDSAFKPYTKPFQFKQGGVVLARATKKGFVTSRTATAAFPVAQLKWKIHYVDSINTGSENRAENAIDGNPNTYWHTNWDTNVNDALPHEIQIDMRDPIAIKAVTYLPRQGSTHNGWIKKYKLYLSNDGKNWGQPAAQGEFANSSKLQIIPLRYPRKARYIRLVAHSEMQGNFFTTVAEISIIPATKKN